MPQRQSQQRGGGSALAENMSRPPSAASLMPPRLLCLHYYGIISLLILVRPRVYRHTHFSLFKNFTYTLPPVLTFSRARVCLSFIFKQRIGPTEVSIIIQCYRGPDKWRRGHFIVRERERKGRSLPELRKNITHEPVYGVIYSVQGVQSDGFRSQ